MSNDHLHPVFQGIIDNLLNKPSEPAAPALSFNFCCSIHKDHSSARAAKECDRLRAIADED
jgi:hypothetical protein